jgi:hypothetical protein
MQTTRRERWRSQKREGGQNRFISRGVVDWHIGLLIGIEAREF